MQDNSGTLGTINDRLVRDALKHWHTSIVESGNDFNRMKSTLTAIMPQIIRLKATKPIDAAANEAISALKKAEMFIENGVELGFIRLPDHDDPALETLPIIKAAIRALSAEPVQGKQWQPIETAPKDMTEIIVLCGQKDIRLGWYFAPSSKTFGWFDQRQKKINPTHWMPLPSAPTSEAEA